MKPKIPNPTPTPAKTQKAPTKTGRSKAAPKVTPVLLVGDSQNNESPTAVTACNDFLRMGAGRSVRGLAAKYRRTPQNAAPTQSYDTLRRWSEKFNWPVRAAQFDADEDEQKSALRMQVFGDGVAQDYERVENLKQLAGFLKDQVFEQGIEKGRKIDIICPECQMPVTVKTGDLVRPYHNVWVADVKQIGSGEDAERIDLEKFNSALISEYRGVLDDVAKEVGDRRSSSNAERKLQALYSKLDLDKLSDKLSSEQLDALSNPNGKEWFEILIETFTRD